MTGTPRPVYVGVIGPSDADPLARDLGRQVGAALAGHGAVVVIGGTEGVSRSAMEEATRCGGTVVSLIPGYDRSVADPRVTVALPTGLGELCNGMLVRVSDVLLSVGGGWGTLLEVALAQRTAVPVVSLRGWQLRDADGRPIDGPVPATTVAEAVRLAVAAGQARREDDRQRIG
jgi:uncharacterized protein (TIGR00725 family)